MDGIGLPVDGETFDNFSFRLNNGEGIDIKLETYGAIISNYVIYRKINTITVISGDCDKFGYFFH